MLISIDGFAAFHLQNTAVALPNIRALAAAGAQARSSASVFPSVTHPARQEGPRRELVEQPATSAEHRRAAETLAPAASRRHRLRARGARAQRSSHGLEQLTPQHAGQVLMEVPLAVRESLFELTSHDDLVRVLLTLDPEDLAFIADSLDPEVRHSITRRSSRKTGSHSIKRRNTTTRHQHDDDDKGPAARC